MQRQRSKGWTSRKVRLTTRSLVLLAAVLLALPVLPWAWPTLLVPALSPYVLIGSVLVLRTWTIAMLVGLPMLLLVLWWRRWLCRYVCPVGMLADLVGRLRPKVWGRARGLPPVGRGVVLLTLGGAALGYPWILWLDPLVILNGALGMLSDPGSVAAVAAVLTLGVIFVVSLIKPGVWCSHLCPLGATQELLALPRQLARRRSLTRKQPTAEGARLLARRSWLAWGLGTVSAALGGCLTLPRRARAAGKLRPPGAVDEEKFTGLCVRCGNCLRACPVDLLKPDTSTTDIAGWLAPVVEFHDSYCQEDCHRCTRVCPSGAISLLSLKQKLAAPIGLAKVDMSICYLADDRECSICANVCPFLAIAFTWSEEEYLRIPTVDKDKCNGCGACEVACPGTNTWERAHSEAPIPLRKAIAIHALASESGLRQQAKVLP